MKLFKSETIYDATKGEFIETFWIDGDTVDADTYFFFLDKEKEIEDKKLEEQEDCECEDISYDELLDVFTMKVLETQGCPGCIREVLEEFSFIFINEEE